MLLDIISYNLHDEALMHATQMDMVIDEAAATPFGLWTLVFNVKLVASLVIWSSSYNQAYNGLTQPSTSMTTSSITSKASTY